MFGANKEMFHFWTKAPANHGNCVYQRWGAWWGMRIHGDRLQFQNGQILNADKRFTKQCYGKLYLSVELSVILVTDFRCWLHILNFGTRG